MDDATNAIYYAQWVHEESTRTVMDGGAERSIEGKELFCALYSDRASHFFLTRKTGELVDHEAVRQTVYRN